MGREKRIAESRTKEVLEKKQGSEPRMESPRSGGVMPAPLPEQGKAGTAKALLEILALFLIPTGLIIVIGKLIFKL